MPTYYVDATEGLDGNDGLSEGSAWRTISKVNGFSFTAVDTTLFKRGEMWRENLIGQVIDPNNLTFGAYGIGAKPIISGSDVMQTWTSYSGNIWQKTGVTTRPKQVFMDGMRLIKGTDRDSLNDYEWIWETGILYVRDGAGNPDRSGVVIEASQRNTVVDINGRTGWVLDNLTIRHGQADGNCGVFFYNGAGVAITNCVVHGHYARGIVHADVADVSGGIVIGGTPHSGNEVFDCGGTAIWLGDNSVNALVSWNHVHDWGLLAEIANHNSAAGILANSPTTDNVLVEHNDVHDGGNGAATESGVGIWNDGFATNVVIRRNHVYNTWFDAIRLELAMGALCYGNFVHDVVGDAGAAGIGLARDVHNNTVNDNVIYRCTLGLKVIGQEPKRVGNVTNNLVKNNIVVASTKANFTAKFGGENDGLNGSGNVYFNNDFGVEAARFIEWGNGVFKDTYAAWEAAYETSSGGDRSRCRGAEISELI